MTEFKFNKKQKYVAIAKKLSELPPNIGTPDYFVKHTCRNFKGDVYTSTSQEDIRLPLMRAVGKGHFIQLVHNGHLIDENTKPLVLIGKGVTFDTGGYNLKTDDMHEMKFDKCGATAVYSVLRACADQDLPIPVIGLLPMCTNLIGSEQTLPGSVVQAFDGTKVEIRDTDAEGRLLLADMLNVAKDLNPELVITVATLTGSCAYALGESYSGLFGNNMREIEMALNAGAISEDNIWHMPIHQNHIDNLKSKGISDILNYNKRECGGSSAAAFLSNFVAFKWLHLDIAGTAWKDDKATGRPVNLLLTLIERLYNGYF